MRRKPGKKTCKQSQSYLRFLGLVQERTSSSPAYDRKTRQNRKNLEERMIRSAVMEAKTTYLVPRQNAPCRALHTPTHTHKTIQKITRRELGVATSGEGADPRAMVAMSTIMSTGYLGLMPIDTAVGHTQPLQIP